MGSGRRWGCLLLAIFVAILQGCPGARAFAGPVMAAESYKVLFLHGKGENGDTFQLRLSALETALKTRRPDVQCDFATAPHAIAADKCAWWNLPANHRSYTTPEYIGMDATLAQVAERWTEKGPYDAVIAHSQGAILTAVLLSKALQTDYAFKPKKAVLFGAAWPKPFESEVQALSSFDYAASPYKPETLHVYAMNDNINPPEMAIQIKDLMGPDAQGYEHQQGHDIPQDEAALAKVCAFLFD